MTTAPSPSTRTVLVIDDEPMTLDVVCYILETNGFKVVRADDVVISLGCGDACPFFPGMRYEDWRLDVPAGRSIEEIRPIRDEVERQVRQLLDELEIPADA